VKITQLCLAVLACVSLACASKPTPVTVTGAAEDRASLAGKWTGEYNSPVTGRSGSIVFNLSSTGQAANGDVVMIPRGYGRALVPYGATTTAGMQTQNVGGSQVLTIKLVRVSRRHRLRVSFLRARQRRLRRAERFSADTRRGPHSSPRRRVRRSSRR